MEISFHRQSPPAMTEASTPVEKCTYGCREITALPRELVEKILTNLGGKDLVVCKRVNRAWQGIVDSTPMLAQAFYRCMHPLAPVPKSLETVKHDYCSVRYWLENFGEPGRKLVVELDQLAWGNARLFPERLFFSLARLLAETPVFHCHKAYTIKHANRINQANFSPDGHYVVTGSDDKTAKVCERIDGQWRETTTLTHPRSVLSAYFSPTGDYCVTTCHNWTIQIWEVLAGGRPWRSHGILPHSYLYTPPCFSADGNYLVTFPTRHVTQILQLVNRQWQQQATLLEGHCVHTALFHPREHLLATIHDAVNVHIWRLVDRRWKNDTTLQHPHDVDYIQFSPDGNRLFVTCVKADPSHGSCAYIYNRADGPWHPEAVPPLGEEVYTARFSPKGDKLITVTFYLHVVTIWQFLHNCWKEVVLPQAGTFTNARFSPDGNRLVTTSRCNTAIIWRDIDGQWRAEATLDLGDSAGRADSRFSPHGHHLVTIPKNRDATIWGIVNGIWQEKSLPCLGQVRPSTFFSPDGLYFLTLSPDETAHIWTLHQGQP